MMSDIPPGTMCQQCRIHPATVFKTDSVTDLTHGHYDLWCQCCTVKHAIRFTEDRIAELPGLRDELRTACQDEVQADPDVLITANSRLYAQLEVQWTAAHARICGSHYPGQDAMNYAHPHPAGEHCYWPKPAELVAW